MFAHRARRAARILAVIPEQNRALRCIRARAPWQSDCTSRARMPGYSSASSEPLSEFRVEKSRAEATLTLSNGTSVHGCFFISGNSRTHPGPEGVRDVLNSETGFFPFDVRPPTDSTTVLYNRDHLVFVELQDKDEPRRDPGYDVATRKNRHDADVQRDAASRRRACVSPAWERSLERFRAGSGDVPVSRSRERHLHHQRPSRGRTGRGAPVS